MKTTFLILAFVCFFKANAQTKKSQDTILPEEVVYGNKIYWGADYNQLYISEDKGKTWEKYSTGQHFFSNINLTNDSSVVIWDAVNERNYLYSLPKKIPELYFYNSPLKEFLKFPVTRVSISSASWGCFHSAGDEIEYVFKDDSTLQSTEIRSHGFKNQRTLSFKKAITQSEIMGVLKQVDSEYLSTPQLSELNFTEENKRDFLKIVAEKSKIKPRHSFEKEFDVDFYRNIASRFDTLSQNVIDTLLLTPTLSLSTSRNGFTLFFINSDNDTLAFINWTDDEKIPKPWYTGWECHYKNKRFVVYNLAFSKSVKSWIPDNFMFSEYFNNSYSLMSIADYLYKKEHPQE